MREHLKVQSVSREELRGVIVNYQPRGLFLARDGRRWMAVDNSTGHAWTEEFKCRHKALHWLRQAWG